MNWVEVLNNAIEYIEDNLLEDLTLIQVAAYVNVSSAHLQRGFSALAGVVVRHNYKDTLEISFLLRNAGMSFFLSPLAG